ncbi:MAG: (2Fe-2S)-binding protein [Candidatus Wallbacteria bacterium]|nr:(2Fe-2S)-binding protein [Candidatus Wallbacteria bacterium]
MSEEGELTTIRCTIDGRPHEHRCHPLASALDFLRYVAGLTATKEGCKEGECGACAITLDGVVVNSCVVPAAHLQGRRVGTVEGLSRPDELSALQKAFLECGGAQCGICTPGMLVTGARLLEEGERLTEARIREHMAGNLCRCTGYGKIVESLLRASEEER